MGLTANFNLIMCMLQVLLAMQNGLLWFVAHDGCCSQKVIPSVKTSVAQSLVPPVMTQTYLMPIDVNYFRRQDTLLGERFAWLA